MRIAILVWGSLYWDRRNLSFDGSWYFNGPSLPVEFARISSGNRLTLVINSESQIVQTLYCISTFSSMQEAIENLAEREGTSNLQNIGFIDFESNRSNVRPENELILPILRTWNDDKGFGGVIWSDFGNNFVVRTGAAFDFDNVVRFLRGLNEAQLANAIQYISRAPDQIETGFRQRIQQQFDA
jgi:hypothetical protein